MTQTARSLVIIGGGLAGARAAEGVREAGYEGPLVLVGAEAVPPYIRPPLSKEFLAGTDDRDAIDVHPREWYDEHRVELRLGRRAERLDPRSHRITLDDGTGLPYERALLATGAAPRPFGGPGGDLDGVRLLRTVDDSIALREALEPGGRRVAIIGAGWIGLEVAAAARGYGNDVTVIGLEAVPLNGAIGDDAGEVFAALHREHGVDLRMSTSVARIVGEEGRATGIELEGGDVVAADLVVVGIGAIPRTELAEAAGLDVGRGVVADAAFRTSDPDVLAVGDVASVFLPFLGTHLRTEHWANAEHAGKAAGRSLAGEAVEYDDIPYFYTDQYDLGMEYSGYGPLASGVAPIFRGDREGRKFVAFWLRDERVVAGMNVNVWKVNDTVQQLIRSRAVVDPAALADPAVPLEALAGVAG
ncbi:3-phenylpropionate/trans-cinnamate dioxygenase ferredoxin reductase subunit [Agromyces flavus]|uniref:3-phenylpropionate/trans-cinnamate dioxygenase ferredoxin reductase subunit n=1 Tax=Agromyces flavus TaxID=589382 RepID=A0A1H1MBQ1_9MICO|nr:FAD-dependent oxidoreductase [Agromyces flavus]MCP2368751.1 3-phenylpropionate/trans-cinnamate dioxygenase ferredoxin reductase subunit [Agromyces flavus]GGI48011.1 pyridine nucleotide-disulfide oxidoreductase [Agromyces flavus]SDR84198.1 3-phenylpropionate/trans-cinnamate dioxygenase ferredoxin reductase subunit [Agromyces flavus]